MANEDPDYLNEHLWGTDLTVDGTEVILWPDYCLRPRKRSGWRRTSE